VRLRFLLVLAIAALAVGGGTARADAVRVTQADAQAVLQANGNHYCALDWHVILLAEFDGGNESYTAHDFEAFRSQTSCWPRTSWPWARTRSEWSRPVRKAPSATRSASRSTLPARERASDSGGGGEALVTQSETNLSGPAAQTNLVGQVLHHAEAGLWE
jgi:hypothetical protein